MMLKTSELVSGWTFRPLRTRAAWLWDLPAKKEAILRQTDVQKVNALFQL